MPTDTSTSNRIESMIRGLVARERSREVELRAKGMALLEELLGSDPGEEPESR